jgi:large subunit ribosomal protein L15
MPLVRRVPKRGFQNAFAPSVGIVNLDVLENGFQNGEEVSPQTLRERKLLKGRFDQLKILGQGTLTKKLIVAAHRFSKTAEEKIRQAGGTPRVLADRQQSEPGSAP